MLNTFIRTNVTLVSIILFLFTFYIIQLNKPAFLYANNGTIRDFGVGYKNKTILPLWLFSLILGIFSYISVKYYIKLYM
jgi:hypothetical protein